MGERLPGFWQIVVPGAIFAGLVLLVFARGWYRRRRGVAQSLSREERRELYLSISRTWAVLFVIYAGLAALGERGWLFAVLGAVSAVGAIPWLVFVGLPSARELLRSQL